MKTKPRSSTRNAMLKMAGNSRIGALCQHELTTSLNKVNQLRHTQTNALLPNVQNAEQAVAHIGNNLDTLAHQERFSNLYEEIQTRSQEVGKRVQQLFDSIKQIFSDFNGQDKTTFTKETRKHVHHQLQFLNPTIQDTTAAQTKLLNATKDSIEQMNRILPKASRVSAPEIQFDRERPTLGG